MPPGHEHVMRIALEEAARGGAAGHLAVASIVGQHEVTSVLPVREARNARGN